MRWLLWAAALASLPAWAGRPLTTEDASVLDEKRCQLEAWVDRGRDAAQGWRVPACNFGAGIEWQAGFARERSDGVSRFSEAYAQAKTLLRPLTDESGWGAGIVAGVIRRPMGRFFNGWDHPYVTLPVSIAAGPALVHVNAGWSRERSPGRNSTTWGLAGELPAGETTTWVAEVFGQDREKPFLRIGARRSVVKDVFDVDVTVVRRPGGTREERFASLGVFWQSGRFLP